MESDQSDQAEGKEASLLLNLEIDCAVFALHKRLFQSIAPLCLKQLLRKLVFSLESARSVSRFLRL